MQSIAGALTKYSGFRQWADDGCCVCSCDSVSHLDRKDCPGRGGLHVLSYDLAHDGGLACVGGGPGAAQGLLVEASPAGLVLLPPAPGGGGVMAGRGGHCTDDRHAFGILSRHNNKYTVTTFAWGWQSGRKLFALSITYATHELKVQSSRTRKHLRHQWMKRVRQNRHHYHSVVCLRNHVKHYYDRIPYVEATHY
eukprot:scaffold88204_cov37-Prasinocladus_malaysianus.AAC.1